MIRRLVQNQQMRTGKGSKSDEQPCLLAARELSGWRVRRHAREADRSGPRANLGLGCRWHQAPQVGVSTVAGVELVELMLGEVADGELLRACYPAGHGRESAGDEL